jgi:hypothetical protein
MKFSGPGNFCTPQLFKLHLVSLRISVVQFDV